MNKNNIYNLMIRNIKDNSMQVVNFADILTTDEYKTFSNGGIEELDKALEKYDSKESFLSSYLNTKNIDSKYYDLFIIYKTSGGYKYLETYLRLHLSDLKNREDIKQNIVEVGMKEDQKRLFLSHLKTREFLLYKSYDHYNNKKYEYNNIDEYVKNGSLPSKKSIESKLDNYLELRKMIDASYRFKYIQKNRLPFNRIPFEEKTINVIEQSKKVSPDQLNIFGNTELKVTITKKQENNDLKIDLEKEQLIELMAHLIETNVNIDDYLKAIDSNEQILNIILDDSTKLCNKFKNYSNRYCKRIDDDLEGINETNRIVEYLRVSLDVKKNKAIVLNTLKTYLDIYMKKNEKEY